MSRELVAELSTAIEEVAANSRSPVVDKLLKKAVERVEQIRLHYQRLAQLEIEYRDARSAYCDARTHQESMRLQAVAEDARMAMVRYRAEHSL